VVLEIEDQHKFIATLQALVEKQERQLLDSKGLAAKLAAANNELAAFERQMSGIRQEAREYAMQKETDIASIRTMFEQRLAEQKRDLELMQVAEKDRSLAQHETERSAQAAKFRAELGKFQKEADDCLKSAKVVEQQLREELQVCKAELEDSSAELQKASDVLKRVSDELKDKTAEQEAGATKLAQMEEELHGSKWRQQCDKEESEKAIRMVHDSLTVLNTRYEERGSVIEELQADKNKLKLQAEALEQSLSNLTAALKASQEEQSKTHELVQSNEQVASDKTQMMIDMEESLRRLLAERENMKNERDVAQNQLKQLNYNVLQGEGEVSSEITQMEESLRKMRLEKEIMKNERDLAQGQLQQMHQQMQQVAEDRTSHSDLIRATLESQLAAMQEEFRTDMANLHEENRRQMSEQEEKTRNKIHALEQSTDDLQKDREELIEQLEMVVNESFTDEHVVRLSADNRALRLQVQELRAGIERLSAPELSDGDDAVLKQGGTVEQMEELEEVVVAQNQELKSVLKRIRDLQDENLKMKDAYEEMEQMEKVRVIRLYLTLSTQNSLLARSVDSRSRVRSVNGDDDALHVQTWQKHAVEWGKEAGKLTCRHLMLFHFLQECPESHKG